MGSGACPVPVGHLLAMLAPLRANRSAAGLAGSGVEDWRSGHALRALCSDQPVSTPDRRRIQQAQARSVVMGAVPGVDWASQTHVCCVINDMDGSVLERFDIVHDAAALPAMPRRLRCRGRE